MEWLYLKSLHAVTQTDESLYSQYLFTWHCGDNIEGNQLPITSGYVKDSHFNFLFQTFDWEFLDDENDSTDQGSV